MCAPCKILLDHPGALAASARLFARAVGEADPAYGPALYLADMATATAAVMIHGRTINVLDDVKMDRAHAWSELACRRATVIRAWAGFSSPKARELKAQDSRYDDRSAILMKWAEEDRLFVTDLVGGEYDGAYVINGTDGIALK